MSRGGLRTAYLSRCFSVNIRGLSTKYQHTLGSNRQTKDIFTPKRHRLSLHPQNPLATSGKDGDIVESSASWSWMDIRIVCLSAQLSSGGSRVFANNSAILEFQHLLRPDLYLCCVNSRQVGVVLCVCRCVCCMCK